jgi:hypothetical protein
MRRSGSGSLTLVFLWRQGSQAWATRCLSPIDEELPRRPSSSRVAAFESRLRRGIATLGLKVAPGLTALVVGGSIGDLSVDIS